MAALGPSAARVRAASSWSSAGNLVACSRQTHFASQPHVRTTRTAQTPLRPTPAHTQPRAAAALPLQARSGFSTSRALEKRQKYRPRDNNRLRGVSSIRRTGPRQFLSVSDSEIPSPVEAARPAGAKDVKAAISRPAIDPNHGLWEFFYDRQVAQPPTKDAAFGRSWTAEELRRKSWDDLHKLWWVCVKERNRIATANVARKHFDLGFGSAEADDRDAAVRQTMARIKHVLTERFYVWEDAVELAKSDPEVDLSGDGPAFRPAAYLEDDSAAAAFDSENTGVAEAASKEGEPQPALAR